MQYMSVIETAESYDFWCALWALGVGVGRTVFVDRPNIPVYLNWYIILAAESGTTRKSSAISGISGILGGTHTLFTGQTSPTGLKLYLHDSSKESGNASANFAISELIDILGKEAFMNTMPGLLTDLYDCPAQKSSPGTLAHGELEFKNVYINFLSASTPSWLVTAINPSVIEGGFASRVIFVVDDKRKRAIAWPSRREHGERERTKELYEGIANAARRVGPIGITKAGLKRFTRWYNTRTTHTDPFMSSFEAREDDHLLRVAACLAINDGTFEIGSRHIGNGSKIISSVKSGAEYLFGGHFSYKAKVAGAIDRVRTILLDAGSDGIRHAELQRRGARTLNAQELKTLINVMHECGMIQIFKVKTKTKIATHYRATKAIEKFGVSSEVLAKLNLG